MTTIEPFRLPSGRLVNVGRRVYLQKGPGCAKRWYTYCGIEDGALVLQPYGRGTVGGTRWVRPEKVAGVEPRKRRA